MLWCYRRYAAPLVQSSATPLTVADIGGANYNGSYADIFVGKNVRYLGVDMAPGPGVDVVLEDPYKLPFEDQSIDIVISGQMLEHCEFFWQTFSEMVRVVKPDGYIFLIAPSAGPIHRYPVDCYRFYPDAYRALAKFAGCHLVDFRHDERGPWEDLVGVFSRQAQPAAVPHPNTYPAPAPLILCNRAVKYDVTRGQRPYLKVLDELHQDLEPRGYLEIGVRDGNSLCLARSLAVGVDPEPAVAHSLPETTHIAELTSDDFFEYGHEVLRDLNPDLVFIDGMHLFEFVLRDFMNVERVVGPDTVVVIDDIFPNNAVQARRKRETMAWMGDVWRFLDVLQKLRQDLAYCLLDTEPSGLLIIAGLDAQNSVLWKNYNDLVFAAQKQPRDPSKAILSRASAIPPSGEPYEKMLSLLRKFRATVSKDRTAGGVLREELRQLMAVAGAPLPATTS